MWTEIVFAFFFFLPAGIANLVPVLAASAPGLRRFSYPLDFYLTLFGKRVFGDHKTFRGLVIGLLVGTLVAAITESYVMALADKVGATLNLNMLALGALMSFGALLGDAVKSFFKRQVGVASGKSWLFFDQADYILGGLVLTLPFVGMSLHFYFYIFLIYFGLHFAVSFCGYLLGLKKYPV